MKCENLTVYYGEGRGKTNAALGNALMSGGNGYTVYIIQFFKAKQEQYAEFIKRLEPEVKMFRFQRAQGSFDELSEPEKNEECMIIKNALNFARKVMTTRECDMLVLDEFLGVVGRGIVGGEELTHFLEAKPASMKLILTGQILPEEVREAASEIYNITIG